MLSEAEEALLRQEITQIAHKPICWHQELKQLLVLWVWQDVKRFWKLEQEDRESFLHTYKSEALAISCVAHRDVSYVPIATVSTDNNYGRRVYYSRPEDYIIGLGFQPVCSIPVAEFPYPCASHKIESVQKAALWLSKFGLLTYSNVHTDKKLVDVLPILPLAPCRACDGTGRREYHNSPFGICALCMGTGHVGWGKVRRICEFWIAFIHGLGDRLRSLDLLEGHV